MVPPNPVALSGLANQPYPDILYLPGCLPLRPPQQEGNPRVFARNAAGATAGLPSSAGVLRAL